MARSDGSGCGAAPCAAFATDAKAEAAGAQLAKSLEGLRQGDTAWFAEPLEVAGQTFTHATVLREYGPCCFPERLAEGDATPLAMEAEEDGDGGAIGSPPPGPRAAAGTGSRARLLQMDPGGQLFVCKLKDMRREHAVMCALRQMNRRWQERGISVLGETVEAVTYGIYPLGSHIGLAEFVPDSATLFELSQRCAVGERHLRVLRYICCDPASLCRLAASTVAHLTMGYALGIRDGHDENLMLQSGGAFFRVDFEFAFGQTPEVDAPAVFVPQAVAFALGSKRWEAVVDACGRALEALSSDDVRTVGFSSAFRPTELQRHVQPPAWDLLRGVPELGPLLAEARAHARTLSLEAFQRDVRQADQWSLSRATKNTIREAVRYLSREAEEWRGAFELLAHLASPKESQVVDKL